MSKQKKLVRLDLACGNNVQRGFVGVDIVLDGTKAKIQCDLTKIPWPFADESVDEIWCSHFLEHLPHGAGLQDSLVDFMNECYRIMKKGSLARFLTPYYTSARAFQDPYHTRYITETSYLYFNEDWRRANKLEHYPIKANFEIVKYDHSVNASMLGRAQEAVQGMVANNWNVVDDLLVTLRKK